jgi:hypothetical protein
VQKKSNALQCIYIFCLSYIITRQKKGKEKELNDYLECIKGLERYKERKQLFNPVTRRVYSRNAIENYEKELINLEKGSSRLKEELHITLTIITRYLERTELGLAGKKLKLGQSSSIPMKYSCIYERMTLANCKCEWKGVLNLIRGNDFGPRGCRRCESEDSD